MLFSQCQKQSWRHYKPCYMKNNWNILGGKMNEEGTIPFCCDYLKNYAKERLYLLLFYKIKKKKRTLDRKRQELNRGKRLLMKLLKGKKKRERTKALESNSLRSFPKRRHKKIPVVFFFKQKVPIPDILISQSSLSTGICFILWQVILTQVAQETTDIPLWEKFPYVYIH